MQLLLVILLLILPLGAHATGLTVFAAASLTDAFKDIGARWQASGHAPIIFSFAASSTLARQIESGAPADVFASADEKWMDALAAAGKIVPASRSDIVGNALVLVEPRAGLHAVELKRGVDLAALLGPAGRLAVGDPAHVPAGIYAKQALVSLHAWNGVKDRLAPAASVRDALELVARGEAPAGIVYATDVRVVRDLAVAGVFPADSHDPILYPVAVTTHAAGAEGREFVAFLRGAAARDVFAHYGFSLP
jgi:molybdate transport system substrate-binding protein